MNDTNPMLLKFEIFFWKISIVVINWLITGRTVLQRSQQWINQLSRQHPLVISLAFAMVGLSLGLLTRLLISGD